MTRLNEDSEKIARNQVASKRYLKDKEYYAGNRPDFAGAMVDSEKIVKDYDDMEDDLDKINKDFIKDNHNRDFKPKKVEGLTKLKLSESLFAEDEVNESFETEKSLYKKAEILADNLGKFLDTTSRLSDRDDFLDEYDLEHLGKAMDCLYDFARMYKDSH